MDSPAPLPPGSAGDVHGGEECLESLIRRLDEAERAIQAFAAGELDAVVDPGSGAPVLLKRAQEALARSEARFRDLFDRVPALVCELTAGGRVLYLNRAVETVLGYAPAELLGPGGWRKVVPPGLRAGARRMLHLMRRNDVTAFELPLRAADGSLRWISWNSGNRYQADGTLAALLLFGVDVTDRHLAQETARRATEAELARARAEAANQAKMEFLAMMSHDLRTPLNTIIGYTDLLRSGLRGPVTTEQVQDLDRIHQSSLYLLSLVEGILDFAKLEAGHVRVENSAVSVEEALAAVAALAAPQVQRKGLELHIAAMPPSLAVWADPEKLRQILLNLVGNAIKFTPPGGAISLTGYVEDDRVCILVRDTGIGIPAEQQESIFDPFVQLESRLDGPREGVGLGLPISRNLARAMGGDLNVESEPGVGSTFGLRLPRAPA